MSKDKNPFLRPEPRIHALNRSIVAEFRAGQGRVGAPFEGGDLLLLTTVGARTGVEQTSPMACFPDPDRLLVVGSAGGSPKHPAWYYNLLAHPLVRVERGAATFGAVAVPTEGTERERLLARILTAAPGYAGYQSRVRRQLPVVAIEGPYQRPRPHDWASAADRLLYVHQCIRDELGAVQALATAFAASRASATKPDPPVTRLRIAQHCRALRQSVEFHFGGLDTFALTDLERQYPQQRDGIRAVRSGHASVRHLPDDILARVAALGDDAANGPHEVGTMLQALADQLDRDETILVPILTQVPLSGRSASQPSSA